jgi:hypothetical protein
MRKIFPWLLAALAAGLLLNWTRPAPACAPFYFPPVFTEMKHPDFPAGPYTQGELGVLQPSYYRIYLYVAYRNLSGEGFSPGEARALWGNRMDLLGQSSLSNGPPPSSPVETDWARAWIDARNRVPNLGPPEYFRAYYWTWPGIFRQEQGPGNRYVNYLNCPPQAFQTALATFEDRTQKYGSGSPDLAAWIRAQDEVFSNCQKGENIPAPLPGGASPLARADRNYQIAAAYFYAGDFAHAEAAFREIAGDHTSPWSPVASYLVARAYIRQATVGRDDNSPDPTALTSAETQLKQVLGDPSLGEFHASAVALLDYVAVRLHPEQRIRELAQALVQKPAPPDLAQKAQDYTFLLDKLENEQFLSGTGELQASRRMNYPKLADVRAHDDLTDWILTFQLDDPAALEHAYEKWQEKKSPAWLVAALTKVRADDARAAELMEAARTLQPSAPAYASATFHRFRLLMQSGQRAEVLPELNRLLARNTPVLPRSALNLFLATRMSYTRDLTDFLKYAQRVPVELMYNFGPNYPHPPAGSPWFDSDALIVLNRQMPLGVLAEAAESKVLPDHLRRQIALGAWTRAFLLGDDRVSVKLAPVAASLTPELRPDFEKFASTSASEARRFAGTILLLRNPGLRPYITSPERSTPINEVDNLRENWWGKGVPCGFPWGQNAWTIFPESGGQQNTVHWPALEAPLEEIYPGGEVPPPSFLGRTQLTQAKDEWSRTQALPVASIVLGEEVLAWARKHPDDPRAAEALALVVRAGHFGCPDANRWKVSKQAFGLLHRRYAANGWAKRTPYWYR